VTEAKCRVEEGTAHHDRRDANELEADFVGLCPRTIEPSRGRTLTTLANRRPNAMRPAPTARGHPPLTPRGYAAVSQTSTRGNALALPAPWP
jgi:hypothetical protein